MRIGINSAQDVFALLVRRKWWVIVPFIALSGILTVLVYFLPHVYVSETLILVRPRDVPQDFVVDLISGSPEERLNAIEQMVLSRTILIQILREFGDELPELQALNMDAKVERLREQINIAFEVERGQDGRTLPLTYFRIFSQNQNPELAQKINSKLTTLFIEQDNKTRESQVFGTTEFFAAELQKVSEELALSDEGLKVVKSTRQYELPDQRDANLRTLDRLGGDKKTNAEALDRYASLRLTLEAQLTQTPQTVPKIIPSSPLAPVSPEVEKMRQQQAAFEEYGKAEKEYEELASRYTARHPELLTAKSRVDRLRERLPKDGNGQPLTEERWTEAAGALVEPNPLYQRLVAQLQEVTTELAIRERERQWIDSQMGRYTVRVENTPTAEQDIAEVVRQNDELKGRYEDLNEKLSEARLAESLESRQKGSQFVIADPANYPIIPAKPNKIAILAAAVLLSLALAIGVAFVVDITRQKVWTPSEIETLWGVPVLIDIPAIPTDTDPVGDRKKMFVIAWSSLAGAVAYGACLYMVYWQHSFILRQLDPMIQQLVYK